MARHFARPVGGNPNLSAGGPWDYLDFYDASYTGGLVADYGIYLEHLKRLKGVWL